MIMSRDQNSRRSQTINTFNSSFQRAELFKYLGTTDQIKIQEEIKIT